MHRQLMITEDGSHSIRLPETGLSYHSIYGAIRESVLVFIEPGLRPCLHQPGPLHILEMGFGTGLNALLTLIETRPLNLPVHYRGIDAFPLDPDLSSSLNYCSLLGREDLQNDFERFHHCAWEKEIPITQEFFLHKNCIDFRDFSTSQKFHLVYFDAFAPDDQPELWTKEIFQKIYQWLLPGGVLVTYSAKGEVRRALQAAGFQVEKLPGPPPKREITRAFRPGIVSA